MEEIANEEVIIIYERETIIWDDLYPILMEWL